MHAAIFFIFLALSSPYSGILAQPPPPIDQYDHHWLVLTWPNGYCSDPRNSCRSPPPQNLVLHGLWPAYSTGVIPTVCSLNNVNIWPLMQFMPKPLRTDMGKYWPSIGSRFRSNDAFWVHEWNQHGTCQLKAPFIYFDAAIQLRKRIDLDPVIRGEVPVGESAPRENFVRALTTKLGDVDPVFQCVNKNGNKLLSEIIICIDKTGTKVIPCVAEQTQDNCGSIIKFPAQTE